MNSIPACSSVLWIASRILACPVGIPIVQQANLPNLEVLDKLMRYQTSLNNQLSKQMGELMELENKYGNKG